jgi:hypothetical protein
MMLFVRVNEVKRIGQRAMLTACVLGLAACASIEDEDKVDVIGSHLAQPPPGVPRPVPAEAGDIAIAGQEFAHSIMDLPAVSGASIPPLVRFNGVTSIINPPIDTEPYTILLRDRLLLITREKLRFVEHTLPPYIPGRKKKSAPQPSQNTSDPDFTILAEMRGRAEGEFFKIQIEFVDAHSNEVLFNGLYRIRRESGGEVEETPAPAQGYEPPPTQASQPYEPPPPEPRPAPSGGANPIY